MKIVIHTSLSSIGYVIGGAATLLDALRRAVGDDGLLAVPTFTYGRTPYDPARTRPVIGAVSTAAAFHPDFHRSGHPTHSFALCGRNASELAAGHPIRNPIGPGSPLYYLYENGGWILLIGVDQRSNTSIHLAEYLAGVGYGVSGEAMIAVSEGFRKVEIDWLPGCSEGFQTAQAVVESSEGYTRGRVGRADTQLIPMKPAVDAVARQLLREPAWLLGHCAWCSEARARVAPRRSPA